MTAPDTPPRELALQALGRLHDDGRLPGFRILRRAPALLRDRGPWRDRLVFQRSKWNCAGNCTAWIHVTVSRTLQSGDAKHDVAVGGGVLGRIRRGLTWMPTVELRSEHFDSDVAKLGSLIEDDALTFADRFDDTLRFVETASLCEIAAIQATGLIPVARHLGRVDALERYYQRRAHAEPNDLMSTCRALAAAQRAGQVSGVVSREAELLWDEGLLELIPERLRTGWRGDERWPVGYLTRCPGLVVSTLHEWGLGHLADAASRLDAKRLGDIEQRVDVDTRREYWGVGKSLVLEVCAELGVDVDPVRLAADGTIYYPPEPAGDLAAERGVSP